MAIFSTANPWAFTFGMMGNVISFIVFLSPLPTFIRIVKKKKTEGFDSIPYLVALFSAMLWIYYATQKSDAFLLITINAFGCVVETIYISLFIFYAKKEARIRALKVLSLLNFGAFSVILLVTYFLTKGKTRVQALGWICVAFSTCVFAAPLSVIAKVIRTKSVEFMPFYLSFFLTISAVVWLLYGISLKDIHVAFPNVLGFLFGVVQMILWAMYRKNKNVTIEEKKLPEKNVDTVKLSEIMITEAAPVNNQSSPNVLNGTIQGMTKFGHNTPNVFMEGNLVKCAA